MTPRFARRPALKCRPGSFRRLVHSESAGNYQGSGCSRPVLNRVKDSVTGTVRDVILQVGSITVLTHQDGRINLPASDSAYRRQALNGAVLPAGQRDFITRPNKQSVGADAVTTVIGNHVSSANHDHEETVGQG